MRTKICPIILFAGISLILSGLLLASLHKREPSTVADVAAEITAGYASTEEKSMAIYRYLTRNFRYDSELRDAILAEKISKHTPDSQQTLRDRKGICCDFAVLCAAMLESQSIKVQIVKGYYNGVYHAWNSIYDEEADRWMQIDVTSDLWYGRSRTAWPEFEAVQYTASTNIDYSALTPLTFGARN